MSSKTKTSATKEEAKPALVPKLRFPEFRGAEEWASEPMSEVYSFKGNNSLSRDKLNYVAGSVKNIHYGDIHTKFSTHFDITKELVPFINEPEEGVVRDENLSSEGDMIFADASEDMADIGKCIEIVHLNGERVVSGLHTIVARRIGDRIALGFGGHLFNSGWVRTQIQKEAQGAKVLGISANRMRNLRLPLPHAPAEQQKIAECLSLVDEVIAAQARKLDALKTHKKGLMQQLFPREGETQPRLRFPEYQNAGEWARMSVQEMIDQKFILGHLDGNHGELYPKAEEFSPNKEGVPYITANDFMNGSVNFSRCKRLPIERARLFKKGVAKDGDILFAHNATVGPVAKLTTSEEFVILSTTATYFRCNGNKLSNDFLKSALSSPDFVAQYSRVMSQSTRNQVPITTQRKLELHVPKPPEQQRIATCLSSLDALISAETQKLEALTTHKKGLMQQLFPSREEVES